MLHIVNAARLFRHRNGRLESRPPIQQKPKGAFAGSHGRGQAPPHIRQTSRPEREATPLDETHRVADHPPVPRNLYS
jgi:hypothetical protein